VPPVNDLIALALPIFDGRTSFSTLCATTTSGLSCFDDGADVFYRYQALVTGTIFVDTCSRATDFDTTLVALNAAGDRIVTCGDDGCGVQSKMAFAAQIGDVFVLRVAGFRRATGTGILNISAVASRCPAWPGPSTCPLVYNASCFSLNFFFDDVASGYGSNGCNCPPAATRSFYFSQVYRFCFLTCAL